MSDQIQALKDQLAARNRIVRDVEDALCAAEKRRDAIAAELLRLTTGLEAARSCRWGRTRADQLATRPSFRASEDTAGRRTPAPRRSNADRSWQMGRRR